MRLTQDQDGAVNRRAVAGCTGWLRRAFWTGLLAGTMGAITPVARGQTTLYWDINGTTTGSGSSSPSGIWSTSSSDKNWATDSSGLAGNNKWTNGATAVFSAGTDATDSYTITISGNVTAAGITFADGTPTITGGTLVLTGATPTFSVPTGGNATINSLISSTTGFVKSGNGTLTVGNSSNAYTGNTSVTAGTLRLGASNALSANSALSISTGATVDFDWSHSATIASLSGNGTLDIKNGTLTVGSSGNTTFSGVITDSGGYGGIVKVGTGTLTLSGNSTFDGQINITQGAVNVQSSSALGGSTWGNTIGSGAALQLQGNVTLTEGSFNVNGSGLSSTGAIRSISGNNTFTGAVVLQSNATIGADAGTLALTGDVNLGSSQTLTVVGAGNITMSGAVYGGGSGITQSGTGTLTFSGNSSNSFGGELLIKSGTVAFNKSGNATATNGAAITIGDGSGAASSATLTLLASNQIPDSSAVLTINSDGRFNLNNQTETINLVAGTGQIDFGTSGKLSIGVNGGSSSFGGTLAGTGTLEKLGGGTLTFDASINFSGTLLLNGGTLALNGYTLTVGTLHITGNSTLDFGNSAASTLNATNFIIDAGITLTVTNWVNSVDYFYAQNWSGATLGTSGSAPANQVAFTGYSASNTSWQSYDHQISPVSPVPEPATYGAWLVALAGAVVWWRRK